MVYDAWRHGFDLRQIRLLIGIELIKINVMRKPSIFVVLIFSFLFPYTSLLKAAESNQTSENIYYKVSDVNNDGEPSNVQYAIFKEENNGYVIVGKGAIAPGQKLPPNCFVCVDEDSDFTISLYHPRVMSTEGKAQVKELAQAEWKILEKGAALNLGDEIRTSAGSVCELQIGKSVVKVDADTHIIFTSMSSDDVMINLLKGKILSVVDGFGGDASFSILTLEATFQAKGTTYLVDRMGPALSVYRGNVEETILSSGKKINVSQGGKSTMVAGIPIKQEALLKDSHEFAQAADFEKSAKRSLSLPENTEWISPKTFTISGATQDVVVRYLDPSSLKKGTEHAVVTTTTTVTEGVVEARMLFRGKQVGDAKLVKAGETAIADFVCAGGLKVQPSVMLVKSTETPGSNEEAPLSKIPDQPPSNS